MSLFPERGIAWEKKLADFKRKATDTCVFFWKRWHFDARRPSVHTIALGAKTRWNLADPLFEFYFSEGLPPNNVWCLSRSPLCLHFPSKFEWSPLNPSKVFSDPPLFGSQQEPIKLVLSSQLIPAFVPLQIKWSPLKYQPSPPPQAINNDRSLMLTGPYFFDSLFSNIKKQNSERTIMFSFFY